MMERLVATTSMRIIFSGSESEATQVRRRTPRKINGRAERALERLGRALEHVSREFERATTPETANDRLQAVNLLMELQYRVYSECPDQGGFSAWCLSLFRRMA